MAATNVLAKGTQGRQKLHRPSSAPRQRNGHIRKRDGAVDKTTISSSNNNRTSMKKNIFKAATYVPEADALRQDRQQRQHRVRPQSAALSGRRRKMMVHNNSRDPGRVPFHKEEGGSSSANLRQRNVIDGMIVVKQWRPKRGSKGTHTNSTRRTSKRPQTAVGTRRSRRPGL